MTTRDALIAAFADRGHQLWVVGGALRDEILGGGHGDEDYATDALPDTIEAIGRDIGAQVNLVGRRFGTIGLNVDGQWSEITTFRGGEVYAPDSRWPDVTFGSTIGDDLARRDFTMNALARSAITGEEVDAYGGRADIAARCIRAVGEPAERFREDPLRILRGIRFASQLDFEVEAATLAGMRETIGLLATLSQERITAELDKLLVGRNPARGLELLRETGALPVILPEFAVMVGCEQNRFHKFDVWGHSVATVAAIEVDDNSIRLRRWAALMHDVGKPPVRHVKPNGDWGFFQHETAGASLSHEVLTRLRVGRQLERAVTHLVRRHMDRPDLESRKSIRRFVARAGEQWPDLLALKRADNASHTYDDHDYHDALERLCLQVAQEDAEALRGQSPLSGDDLMDLFGRPPGPWIQHVKGHLSQAVLDGDMDPHDTDAARALAIRLMGEDFAR